MTLRTRSKRPQISKNFVAPLGLRIALDAGKEFYCRYIFSSFNDKAFPTLQLLRALNGSQEHAVLLPIITLSK